MGPLFFAVCFLQWSVGKTLGLNRTTGSGRRGGCSLVLRGLPFLPCPQLCTVAFERLFIAVKNAGAATAEAAFAVGRVGGRNGRRVVEVDVGHGCRDVTGRAASAESLHFILSICSAFQPCRQNGLVLLADGSTGCARKRIKIHENAIFCCKLLSMHGGKGNAPPYFATFNVLTCKTMFQNR